MKKTIKVIEGTGRLRVQYEGQSERQPIYLELDPEKREVTIGYNPEIGNAYPCDVWNGLLRWYYIPLMSRRNAARFARKHIDLFARVCDGWSRAYDGNRSIGRMSDDAIDAEMEIGLVIEELR